MSSKFCLNGSKLTLFRYPKLEGDKLQAWNAADEYLLTELAPTLVGADRHNILLVNDSFGALACALNDHHCFSWSDSYISQQASLSNLKINELNLDHFNGIKSTEMPPENISMVLMKLPKSSLFLEYQLATIQPLLSSQTIFNAAGMVKEIHSTTLKLFEKIIGPTTTSLARKKARLIYVKADLAHKRNNRIKSFEKNWAFDFYNKTLHISNLANVFGRNQLDAGAEILINNLPREEVKQIIDLGCGNGVLGLAAACLHPQANVSFVDESFMATASAKKNVLNNFSDTMNRFQFFNDNCLDGFSKNSADLILCNPPFHQQQTITDHIAWQMMQDAHRVLKPGGRLLLVGNRHLNYHVKMKRIFGNQRVVDSNKNFVVLESRRS